MMRGLPKISTARRHRLYCTVLIFFADFSSTLHNVMDTADLLPLLEQLDDNVDDLEEVLQPFLGQSLSKASKNLPVMDKAKLHVLITYTLESLIFCTCRTG
jgi:hypothetical protein